MASVRGLNHQIFLKLNLHKLWSDIQEILYWLYLHCADIITTGIDSGKLFEIVWTVMCLHLLKNEKSAAVNGYDWYSTWARPNIQITNQLPKNLQACKTNNLIDQQPRVEWLGSVQKFHFVKKRMRTANCSKGQQSIEWAYIWDTHNREVLIQSNISTVTNLEILDGLINVLDFGKQNKLTNKTP